MTRSQARSSARQYLEKDRPMILWLFDERCVRCGRKTNEIHEIVPISHNKFALHWKNRVPVCRTCHDWAHSVGTNVSIPILEEKRKEFLVKRFGLDENG